MSIIEYPKMLYLDGEASKKYVVVADADEEKSANADGYCRIGEEIVEVPAKPAKAKPRKGR